ncbi:acidic mammalian chitinase-like [Gordionus sp. m RMFG-2023]|uniref:acidic mammalian chitinase-like n=1 Tax=Gordionus sp. m RMFG-2023 TaxID=3053472 RepID=UPI0031FC6039
MTYDFHGAGWESSTGHNAPLFGTGPYTTKGCVDEWIKKGLKSEKIVIGLPFYGRTWQLRSSSNHGVGAPSVGAGSGDGFLALNDINISAWTQYWDDTAKVPYAVKGTEWLSFDNERSLEAKIQWACQKNYQGVMIWELSQEKTQSRSQFVQDKLESYCGEDNKSSSQFVLDKSESFCGEDSILLPLSNSPITTSGATQHTNLPVTTGSSNGCNVDTNMICLGKSGLAKYPPDCNKYVDCRLVGHPIFSCPSNLQLNEAGQYCDWENNVNCVPLSAKVIVGYIPSWSQQNLDISNINGNLITHLLYAFVPIGADGKIRVDSPADFQKLKNLTIKYPNLKILPSVGGATWRWMFDQLSTDALIQTFATSCKTVIQQYGLHGIDIDWEYPYASEKAKYGKLLQVLRQTLGSNLLIMSAVPAGVQNFVGFDEVAMNNYLDYVLLMTYDFHGAGWESNTGHNAPLFGQPPYTTKGCADEWINKGLRSDKIVIGLAFYGRTWRLQSSANYSVGAPSVGVGSGDGFLALNDISNSNWNEYWDDTAKVPYAVIGTDWLSYDNERSLEAKIQWTCQNNYQGVMIWELSQEKTQSLVSFVQNKLNYYCGGGSTNPPVTNPPVTNPPVTTAHTTQHTNPPVTTGGNNGCISNTNQICNGRTGFASYPPDCNKYVDCRVGNYPLMNCPSGLVFNEAGQYCDWTYNVNCSPC